MTIEVLYIMLFFILGTIMGSFYNVVAYRLPKGMSLIKPASHCPNCNKRLGAMELIPVFSYILQLGKCKHCKKKIPIFYPVFECLTGIMFAISYLVFGLSLDLALALIFSSTILIVIISDIKYMIIPDEVLIVSGILIIIIRLIMGIRIEVLLMNALISFMMLLMIKLIGDFIFKKESLGGGDIKLMAVIGLVIGWQNCIFVIALSSFIALPISLIILAVKRTNIIPFGPFLSLAALILYYFAIDYSSIVNWLIKI